MHRWRIPPPSGKPALGSLAIAETPFDDGELVGKPARRLGLPRPFEKTARLPPLLRCDRDVRQRFKGRRGPGIGGKGSLQVGGCAICVTAVQQ